MTIWYLCKYSAPAKHYGTRHFFLADEWVKRGHKVYVFTANTYFKHGTFIKFKGKFLKEIINGVYTIWLNTYMPKKPGGIERIKSWFHFEWQLYTVSKKNIEKPDIIIISSLSLLTIINAYIFSRRYKSKLIFEVRDIWPLSAMKLGGYSKYHPFMILLSIIEKFGYKKADAIVGTMPNIKKHVETVIGKNDKCFCIPQGLNIEAYRDTELMDPEYIEKYIPKNKFIIAYAGTLNSNNPLDTYIEAARLLKNNTQIHFLILGKGYLLDHWKEKSRGMENISFLPFLPRKKVAHFLRYVNVCYDAFDSDLAQFGLSRNKWIDYMAAGKPIICSYSGFQSMINEVQSGCFVEYGDSEKLAEKIIEFSQMSPSTIDQMGDRAKKYIYQHRTFEVLSIEYEKLFNLV